MCVCLPHCASLTLFRAKWKPAGEIKRVRMRIKKKQCCIVGLLACDGTNTNEAIWPERQVNEECWLKRRAECRIKGLSCSLWAMLCADSCFSKTLRGGSGYRVPSDKKPHNRKGRGLPGVLAQTCERTHKHRHIKDIKHVRSYTTKSTHTEKQVACHRLVTNGIGRPV